MRRPWPFDENMTDTQKRVTAAVEAFERGEIVVVTDDDDRENEGDLVMAAVHATPEKMAFIIRNTCRHRVHADARRDRAPAAPCADGGRQRRAARHRLHRHVDYKHGTTTGISADDRTATVRNLANNNAGAADFVRPGHIFPLIAKDGGVLMRSGHTEAAIDLCRLADLEPVGVICELVNDDGTVMRGPQIKAFAEKHKLQADFGRRPDRLSPGAREAGRARRRVLRSRPSIGTLKGYAYVTPFDKVHHMALVHGAHRRRRRRADAAASRQRHPPTCSAARKA